MNLNDCKGFAREVRRMGLDVDTQLMRFARYAANYSHPGPHDGALIRAGAAYLDRRTRGAAMVDVFHVEYDLRDFAGGLERLDDATDADRALAAVLLARAAEVSRWAVEEHENALMERSGKDRETVRRAIAQGATHTL